MAAPTPAANAVRTPSPAGGLGRRVTPGRLDVAALVRAGALTREARDGSAFGQVVVRVIRCAPATSAR